MPATKGTKTSDQVPGATLVKMHESCRLAKLTPYEKNPRINDAAVDATMVSMQKHGLIAPILVDENYRICCGHTRLKAAMKLGHKTFPVIVYRFENEAAFVGYNIADNQTASIAGWDVPLLKQNWDFLQQEGYVPNQAGFAKGELDQLFANITPRDSTEDDIPPAPKKPRSKPGDLYILGAHRLLCGDATKAEDIARLMAGDKGGLVLTDPPYGINIVKGLSTANGAKPFGRVRQPGGRPAGVLKGKVGSPGVVQPRLYAPVRGDDKPFDPTSLLTLGKGQVIFGGAYFSHKLPEGTAWLCWDKGISDETTFSAFELAWTSFKGRYRMYRHRWSGMVREGPRAEELKDRLHPTQKPVGLFAAIIDDISKSHVAVIDPYLGSGTTMIACEKLGRICYGMEIEPTYIDAAVKRWENYSGLKAERIREGTNGKGKTQSRRRKKAS